MMVKYFPSNAEFNMLKISNFSILLKIVHVLVWGFVFFALIIPSSTLVAQDDVEEFFGDDDEYEDDEYLR